MGRVTLSRFGKWSTFLLDLFEKIADHINRPLSERTAHIDLGKPCVQIGTAGSKECRALLAHFLTTTVPANREALLCHACGVRRCSSPYHLYWGTSSENLKDAYSCGVRPAVGFALLDRESLAAVSSKGGKATWAKIKMAL